MLENMERISEERLGIPIFLAADEEGGQVSRLYGTVAGIPYIGDMYSIGAAGDSTKAWQIGQMIAN